jgi:hypothetical protein
VIIAYLDDFCVAAESEELCQLALDALMSLLSNLGFTVNHAKTCLPAERVCFLGIIIDTESGLLELPDEKLADLETMLMSMATKARISVRQLQRLICKLNWFCAVAKPARTFLRYLIDICVSLSDRAESVPVQGVVAEQLQWWLHALRIIPTDAIWHRAPNLVAIETDACNQGGGIILHSSSAGSSCCYVDFRHGSQWLGQRINVKEACMPMLAIILQRHGIADSSVAIYTDNSAAVGMLNRGSAGNAILMHLIRVATSIAMQYNIRWRVFHMPGNWQILADPLSRCLTDAHHMRQFLLTFMGISKAHTDQLHIHALGETASSLLTFQIQAAQTQPWPASSPFSPSLHQHGEHAAHTGGTGRESALQLDWGHSTRMPTACADSLHDRCDSERPMPASPTASARSGECCEWLDLPPSLTTTGCGWYCEEQRDSLAASRSRSRHSSRAIC